MPAFENLRVKRVRTAGAFLMMAALATTPPTLARVGLPASRPGLFGAWYGNADLTNFKATDVLPTLERGWAQRDGRGREWSARWVGDLTAPADGLVTFKVETNQAVSLEINHKLVLRVTKGHGTATAGIPMARGRKYPVAVSYTHVGDYDGAFHVRWRWAGRGLAPVPATSLRHSATQETALTPQPEDTGGLTPGTYVTVPVNNVTVYREAGRFGGWPSNNGVWSWGNEILVGFERGYYKANAATHSIDTDMPQRSVLARSLDGGQTWKIENPANWPGRGGQPAPCPGGINFADPNLAIRVSGREFYVSSDRGRAWRGPWQFTGLDFDLTSRTDYLVNGKNACTFFLSANEQEVNGSNYQDRALAARTSDGGRTFRFLSWMTGEPLRVRSVMPSTVRTSPSRLVSVMRRKDRIADRDANWIDAYVSGDSGASWHFISKVAETDRGRNSTNGNPPAMVRLRDGRLVVAYGYRAAPYGIRARISKDGGKTWGKEIILRQDGGSWDLGYPRMVVRPDGKIVTIYYFNTQEHPEQHICATIWDPGALNAATAREPNQTPAVSRP